MNIVNLKDIGLNEKYMMEAKIYDKNLYIGRVSFQHKNIYKVITEEGEIKAEVSGKFSYSSFDNVDYPVVGDWVLVDRKNDSCGNGVIHHVLKRKSYFERKIAGTAYDTQIVAANIDRVFICMSLNNDFNLRKLERYVATAWNSGAEPVIVLTKSDLCNDLENKVMQVKTVVSGCDMLVTNSINEEGYKVVKPYIENGKTIAFIGSSGVGKSTLINKIIGSDELKTNEVDENDRGKHTTTYRQMLIIPNGGTIIDTPGMRELGVVAADLDRSFSDIEELIAMCKFSNCTHRNEPKCAIREAIENGILDERRFESYKKLQKELEYNNIKGKELKKRKNNLIFKSKSELKNNNKNKLKNTR
ncbi:ribosome small subunit-dependent GTPase A [Clostridium sp. ATCC 25772]|uniref:ribosome small subunit-dependent GTPase A n=1 Tax=Clostridium sp. ATCC 25772 TaxID=1676991 RepID=UPI000781A631|nr:ribosome small subunit-dependent GTPase A [Clostridium sp. ATCC 25772]